AQFRFVQPQFSRFGLAHVAPEHRVRAQCASRFFMRTSVEFFQTTKSPFNLRYDVGALRAISLGFNGIVDHHETTTSLAVASHNHFLEPEAVLHLLVTASSLESLRWRPF